MHNNDISPSELREMLKTLALAVSRDVDDPDTPPRRAKKPDIPAFDGTFSVKAKEWVDQVDRTIVSGFTTAKEVTRALPLLLTDDALMWYSNTTAEERNSASWDTWKQRLLEKFLEPRTWVTALHEMVARTLKPSETVHKFARDKEKLFHEVFPGDEFDAGHLKQAIVHELPLPWQLHLGAEYEKYSVDELVHRLALLDEQFDRSNFKDTRHPQKRNRSSVPTPSKVSPKPSTSSSKVPHPFPCSICQGNH